MFTYFAYSIRAPLNEIQRAECEHKQHRRMWAVRENAGGKSKDLSECGEQTDPVVRDNDHIY